MMHSFHFKSYAVKGLRLLLIMLFLMSNQLFAQDPGGNPDGPPPAVPFDDYLHLVLIVVGAVFALFAIKKLQRLNSAK